MAIERLDNPGDVIWQACAADHLARYQFAAKYAPGRTVLDAGTGIGYGAALLSVHGASRVFGIDIDAKSIDIARTRFANANVTYLVGDCEILDAVEGQFELICSFENIEHLKRPENFLRRAAAKLSSEGLFICSTPDRASTPPFVNGKPANPYHVNEWYRDEFRELVSRHFRSVEMFVQVKTYAQAQRESLAEAVINHTDILREPFVRFLLKLGRILRLLGKRSYSRPLPDESRTAITESTSFPIVHEALATLYGTPLCHVVLCRTPIL